MDNNGNIMLVEVNQKYPTGRAGGIQKREFVQKRNVFNKMEVQDYCLTCQWLLKCSRPEKNRYDTNHSYCQINILEKSRINSINDND